MTEERQCLELRIGWDLKDYTQEQIEYALNMNNDDAIDYLLNIYYKEIDYDNLISLDDEEDLDGFLEDTDDM